jgi:hypothetical protein
MCIEGLYLRRCLKLLTFVLNIVAGQFYKAHKYNIGRFCTCSYVSKSPFIYLIGKYKTYKMAVKTQQFYYDLLSQGYMFRLIRVIIRPSTE